MDDRCELEDLFILRLPKAEATYVHKLLHEKPRRVKKSLQLELSADLSRGVVHVKKHQLEATMVELPTVVESYKTYNRVNLYKTGSITQMLVCAKRAASRKHPHGITPPLKNVRIQRFRKTMRNREENKELADIQKEVALLLRADCEAVSSRFELVNASNDTNNNNNNNNNEATGVTEHMLFGELSSSDSEGGSSGTSDYDIMEFNN